MGKQKVIKLGNMDAKRDWGYTPEYTEGMWRMLQHTDLEDFVLATGETNTVRKFVELTFAELGIELEWKGEAEKEVGIVKSIDADMFHAITQSARRSDSGGGSTNLPAAATAEEGHAISNHDELLKNYSVLIGSEIIAVDPNYYRPTEVDLLIGNPSKAKACPPIFKAGETWLGSGNQN